MKAWASISEARGANNRFMSTPHKGRDHSGGVISEQCSRPEHDRAECTKSICGCPCHITKCQFPKCAVIPHTGKYCSIHRRGIAKTFGGAK